MDEVRRVQIEQVSAAVAPARCPPGASGIAVAYSGGPDSAALLHALARAGHAIPLRALHVCHNLQAEAAQWVSHCRAACAQQGLPFECLDVRVDVGDEGMEAAARKARYDALAGALRPGEVLALAHHADDQAETFLIQALRGAGVVGLAAMPEQAAFAGGCVWRPLLGLPRQALLEYAKLMGLDAVQDPSNRDTRLDRGYLRQNVWPALTRRWPGASDTLSRSAHWCAEAAALVEEVAEADAKRVIDTRQRLSVEGLQRLSPFRQAGVLRHWLAAGGYDAPDHRHIGELQRLFDARQHAGPRVTWAGTEVRLFDGHLHAMRPLPVPPGDWSSPWLLNEPLALPQGCGALRAEFTGAPRQSLTVCFRRGGERFADPRRTGHHRLKEFLQEARIPPWERTRLPLVYDGARLVAIADYWLDPGLEQRLGVAGLRLFWQRGPSD